MEALEYKILAKRQELRDVLNYALSQHTVFLPVIRQLRTSISLCNQALVQLYRKRAMKARLG